MEQEKLWKSRENRGKQYPMSFIRIPWKFRQKKMTPPETGNHKSRYYLSSLAKLFLLLESCY